MAGLTGFEPIPTESKSVVLPLHYSPIFAEGRSRTGNVARLMWSRTTRAITSLCRLVTSAYVNKAHQKKRLFFRQLRLPITPFAQCRQSRNRTYNSLLESLLYVPLCNVRPQPLSPRYRGCADVFGVSWWSYRWACRCGNSSGQYDSGISFYEFLWSS